MSQLTPVLTDAETLRGKIHEKVTGALTNVFPMDLKGRTLEVKDLKVHHRDYSSDEQKKALLSGDSLQTPVKGTLVLKGADGRVIDEAKNFTLVHIPYMTPRHTVIADGNEYQFANQIRRKPGVYTQRAENGELKTIFNTGRGKNFDLGFNEAKGTFALQYGTSNIPLYAALRGLGVTHDEISKHLGEGVAKANQIAHEKHIEAATAKLYQKLEHPAVYDPKLPHAGKVEAIKKKYSIASLDPEVTEHTLGQAHDRVSPTALLHAAKKMLAVHNGKVAVDDTDSLTFKTFHAVDDFLAERIRLTARTWAPKAKMALSGKNNIREALRPAPFSDSIRKFVTTSSLTAVPSGINPLELMDHAVKVTSLGEGGISSDRAIPLDARMTHATHFGALDPIRTPESGHAGVDIRATIAAHRDDKGNFFTAMRDAKTGKQVFMRAGDLVKNVVAFPGQNLKGNVKAFVNGKIEDVPGSRVTHEMLHLSHQYSPATSLIPMIHNIQGNRAIMGSKMGTQALPLLERETPYVQVKSHLPGDVSFETVYGHLTVPTSPVSGTVEKIKDGYIYIRPHVEKKAESRTAVIITGNPRYIANNPKAEAYYQAIEDHLAGLGYSVKRDAGAPYTSPTPADLWVGHSRGADRLRFAPTGTRTVAFGSSREGAVNHPADIVDQPAGSFTPPDEHYVLTDEMRAALGSEKKAEDRPVIEQKKLGPHTFNLEMLRHQFEDAPGALTSRSGSWDYGHLPGYTGPDGDSLDFFVGDHPNGLIFSFDKQRNDDGKGWKTTDTKFVVGVTPEQKAEFRRRQAVYNAGPAPMRHTNIQEYKDWNHLQRHIDTHYKNEKTAADDKGLIKVPYETNFPFPSKTYLNHDIQVKPGQKVQEGQRLGDSNFTRNGTLALGKNLLVGYMAYHGLNSNDAVVISEGCAKKLTSEHMYRELYPLSSQIELSRDKHKSYYGNKFSPQQYAKLDADGVIKTGTRVDPKDPLVLGLTRMQVQGQDLLLGRISKSLTKPYKEVVLQWEHGTPGVVVEVVKSSGQIAILIKTHEQMQVGDKLCYDAETEVLTARGWKYFSDLDPSQDRVASLDNGELTYVEPEAYHRYAQGGRMYKVATQQLDLCVTAHHRMYVQKRGESEFALRPAEEIAGKRVRYKKDAAWKGVSPEYVTLPALTVAAGQGGRGSRTIPSLRIPVDTYAMLLGAFLSEGNIVDQPKSGSYGIDITQIKEPQRTQLLSELKRLGVKFNEHARGTKVRVYSKQLLEHFRQFGHAADKFIPEFVFAWSRPTLKILFDWLVWGDGSSVEGRPVSYITTSQRLADDVQRLCLHVGYAGNIKRKKHRACQSIKGKEYNCLPCYDVRIVTTKLQPQVNHGHTKNQNAQSEEFIENYTGPVFCVTVPSGVIYVRRNGKSVWSGNSGRYGNKGVVAKIVPDHEMIQDEKGRPLDLILTSAGVVSRINPAQVIETAVGKVVEKTGKPILYDNQEHKDAVKWAKGLLKEHGIKDKEHVYDPISQRKIVGPDGKGVLVGRQFIYKLFKSTDTNFSGHGVGPYDVNEQPLKTGGDESAKGIGKMELDAIVAHNARNFLQEASTIKSQKNDEFWRAIQLGMPLPRPKPTFAFNKFTAMLEGAGIKVDKRGSKFKLLPMTDKDIVQRSKGAITEKETLIAKNLRPIKDGLFDPLKTGGPQGTLYSHIDLHEPMPNPVFTEPVRRLLGLTTKEFEQKLQDHGGAWFHKELKKIDVDQRLATLTKEMNKASGPALDNLVKQVKYLRALKDEGMKPHEAYILSKVPVIPPVFRPVLPEVRDPSKLMVADANKLYGHLMDTNNTLKNTALESDRGKHRALTFKAVGAVFGMNDPEDEKLQKQEVKGFLQNIAGVGTPKGGFFQRKLMRRTQDMSGRGTAVPDGNLGMDEVGIPEQMLWQMYDKMIVARLIRQGYSALVAREMVDKKQPVARQALEAETRERPVLINRAPTLHRWSVVAAYPKMVQGKTIRVNPFVEKGMNLDYDGDTLQVHAPIQAGAIEDAKKMTLSQMLLADQQRNKLMAFPQHEAIIGFTLASKAVAPTGPVHHFKTRDEALAAWRSGKLKLTDGIVIEHEKKASEEYSTSDGSDAGVDTEEALFFWPAESVTGHEE